MTIINNEDMYNIKGGAARWGIYAGIGAFATFVAGFIDGQIKLKWQNRKNTEFKGNSEGKRLIQIRRKD